MPAGTIALTNGSTAVTGKGTSFTSELKAGDFVYVTVGGAPYTLVASAIGSNTQLTLAVAFDGPTTSGLAWNAVPASLQVAITQKILNDFASVARGRILDFQNWQKIYSSDASVTVTRPDRTQFTGPGWGYMAAQFSNKANTADVLTKADNLASVNDKSAARTNLGLSYGTAAGTVAAGNDPRITGAMPVSGGTFTGPVNSGSYIRNSQGFTATGKGVPLNQQGTHVSWNENSGSGRSSIINNRGGGTGGLDIRMINQANSAESAKFAFDIDGAFRAPNGSYSVGGRVRMVAAIASNYIAIDVDGNQKGINFFDSDERLKEGVIDADQDWAIDALRQVRPVSFKYKDYTYSYMSPDPITGEEREAEGVQRGGVHKYGVIAQEIEQVYPEMVITNDDGMKALDPLEAIGWLLAICRKQQSTIDDIKNKLSNLDKVSGS